MERDLSHVDVPLGETVALYTGAILRDNKLVVCCPPDMGTFRIPLSFRANSCKISTRQMFRRADGSSLFPNHLVNVQVDRIDQLLMLSQDTEDGKYRIIVPCQEIFRFYYMTSSRLGRIVASADILEPQRVLFSENTYAPDTGAMHLVVKQAIPADDVPIFARWLTHNQYGLEAAKDVGCHMLAKVRAGETVSLRAKPPFEGRTTWEVQGRSIEDGDTHYLIVYRIVSCSAPSGFDSLTWYYSQEEHLKRRYGKASSPGSPPPTRVDAPLLKEFVPLKNGERPSTTLLTKIVGIDDLCVRFPAFNFDAVTREQKPTTAEEEPDRRKPRIVPGDAESDSAQPGGAKGKKGRREINLAAKRRRNRDEDESEESPEANAQAALSHVLSLCDELERSGCIRVDRVDDRDAALAFGRAFNLLPETFEGKKLRFLYLDDKKTVRRPLYIGEFNRGELHGYVMELVRGGTDKELCTLLVWEKENKQINANMMGLIIAEFVERRKLRLSGAKLEALGLCAQRFLHLKGRSASSRARDVKAILRLQESESSEQSKLGSFVSSVEQSSL